MSYAASGLSSCSQPFLPQIGVSYMPIVITSNWPPLVAMSVVTRWRSTASSSVTHLSLMSGLACSKFFDCFCISIMWPLLTVAITSSVAANTLLVHARPMANARRVLRLIVLSPCKVVGMSLERDALLASMARSVGRLILRLRYRRGSNLYFSAPKRAAVPQSVMEMYRCRRLGSRQQQRRCVLHDVRDVAVVADRNHPAVGKRHFNEVACARRTGVRENGEHLMTIEPGWNQVPVGRALVVGEVASHRFT